MPRPFSLGLVALAKSCRPSAPPPHVNGTPLQPHRRAQPRTSLHPSFSRPWHRNLPADRQRLADTRRSRQFRLAGQPTLRRTTLNAAIADAPLKGRNGDAEVLRCRHRLADLGYIWNPPDAEDLRQPGVPTLMDYVVTLSAPQVVTPAPTDRQTRYFASKLERGRASPEREHKLHE